MSGEDRRAGELGGPEWSPEMLAELHAGALDEETAARLRPATSADPAAAAVLTALETTRTQLAEQVAVEIPEEVAARIERSLAAEPLPVAADGAGEQRARHAAESRWPDQEHDDVAPAAGGTHTSAGNRTAEDTDADREPAEAEPAEVIGIGRASGRRGGRRRRRFTWGSGLVAAAAAVLAVVLVTSPGEQPGEDRADDTGAGPPAASDPSDPPLALTGERATLNGRQLRAVLSSSEQYAAPLEDPRRLLRCLQANGVSDSDPMGAQRITFNGEPAQLMVLSTGKVGQFRLLTVGTDCGPGNPATMSDTLIGG
ncbi:hypothetical protein SAMN04487905_108151 [Actinopolyspora xinjiangensis]|uniref:Anti-sigma-M factor RsmA n=1 Tax=Actinopolyspora xinjiangensis TaxID=405564 RepID=A0A1H0VB20_9ACTN|nr:hypothetical protein [Actinopolyspora xinjiangensis]SDP75732.1 hypothetical protein SAMN04487905_108151 [Actinopolyspora xinjiangensis]